MSEQNSIINTIIDGLIGGAIAAVINSVIYFVAGPFIVQLPDGTTSAIAFTHILGASIVPAIFAAIFLWLLRHFTKHGTRIFQVVAVVFLVISFFNPFSMAVTTAMALWLSLMHVVVGTSIIWALTLR